MTSVPTLPTIDGRATLHSGRLFDLMAGTGAPDLVDISVALGRICRFAGQGRRFWPVLLHSFVVADLLPTELKAYGLLHDATEAIMGDVPRGFKTADYKVIEAQVETVIFSSLGLPAMSVEIADWVKIADNEALAAEAWIVGPPGLGPMIDGNTYPQTRKLIEGYLNQFPADEYLRPDGLAVLEFQQRAEEALRQWSK